MIDTQPIRERYEDDTLIQYLCDWIDQRATLISEWESHLAYLGMEPTGWGITNMNVTMDVAQPVRMSLELIQKRMSFKKP